MTQTPIRVRFAPSPTGYLHVGGLRTALYNYLFAKKNGGTYVLRIEDTDQNRFVAGAVEGLITSLSTMRVTPDEGVFLTEGKVNEDGEYGPYIQSQRLSVYQEYVQKLLENGKAYHCFCTQERLEELRTEQTQMKQAPRYDKHCLSLSEAERNEKIQSGTPYVIRLNVGTDRGVIAFSDIVRGKVSIHAKDIDDQVLIKSDGFPTYHLANVVDDHLMHITHVIRGEEWLPSTPKHILLYEAFGWEAPAFAHLPLLLNPDKSKLSKRQGDVAVEDYLQKGYLQEALINFVALLGWNPGKGSTQELFSLEELVEVFDLSSVHKAGAVFDLKKLDWMNSAYIKKLSLDELYVRAQAGGFLDKDLLSNTNESTLKKILAVEQDRLVKLSDIGEANPFFFQSELEYDAALLHWKENSVDMTMASLEQAAKLLENMSEDTFSDKAALEAALLEAAGEKRGDFLWPLRVALTGAQRSPSPAEVAWVLGKKESLKRINAALQWLK